MAQAFLRLIGMVLIGYAIFYHPEVRKRFLPITTFIVMNIMFPLYSITRYGLGWDAAAAMGIGWMGIFFLLAVGSILFQFIFGRFLLKKTSVFGHLKPENTSEFTLLFSLHNAGYIPLPIISAIAGPGLLVFMFSYVLAFNLIFWTIARSVIEGGGITWKIKLNMPLIGLISGSIIAATGLYKLIPLGIRTPVELVSQYAMDGILLVLGGILTRIPMKNIGKHKEFRAFVVIRQILYPLAVYLIFFVIRQFLPPSQMLSWFQLVMVLEAAVPPATNTMIASQLYGTEEQVHYAGEGTIVSYLTAVITLPAFVMVGLWL